MHEMAITRSVLSIALDEAKKHNARAVRSVELLIGEYSGAIPACVEEYFNILSRGTIAEHARLVLDTRNVFGRLGLAGPTIVKA